MKKTLIVFSAALLVCLCTIHARAQEAAQQNNNVTTQTTTETPMADAGCNACTVGCNTCDTGCGYGYGYGRRTGCFARIFRCGYNGCGYNGCDVSNYGCDDPCNTGCYGNRGWGWRHRCSSNWGWRSGCCNW